MNVEPGYSGVLDLSRESVLRAERSAAKSEDPILAAMDRSR